MTDEHRTVLQGSGVKAVTTVHLESLYLATNTIQQGAVCQLEAIVINKKSGQ